MATIPDELKKMLIADVSSLFALSHNDEVYLSRAFEISISQFYKKHPTLTPEQLGEMFDAQADYVNTGHEQIPVLNREGFICLGQQFRGVDLREEIFKYLKWESDWIKGDEELYELINKYLSEKGGGK